MRERNSLAATLAALLGLLGLLLVIGGAAGANRGLLLPFAGFRLFSLGLLLGLPAALLGSIGLLTTRASAPRAGRGRAWLGTLLGIALLGTLLGLVFPVRHLPRINDITTDPMDPPAFEAAARDPANQARDLSYPGPRMAQQQREAYPDLAPIQLAEPPRAAFERAQRTAEALGWTIVHADAGAGRIEAVEVSGLFRFVDDVVVRIRPAPSGSQLDVRSKSRDGVGDLGANTRRIRTFRAALRGASPAGAALAPGSRSSQSPRPRASKAFARAQR